MIFVNTFQNISKALLNTFIDDVYLLQFLRAKKYNMSRAFETVENYYLSRKTCPELMRFDDACVNKSLDLRRTGCVYPLSGRDQEGRKIIWCNAASWMWKHSSQLTLIELCI